MCFYIYALERMRMLIVLFLSWFAVLITLATRNQRLMDIALQFEFKL